MHRIPNSQADTCTKYDPPHSALRFIHLEHASDRCNVEQHLRPGTNASATPSFPRSFLTAAQPPVFSYTTLSHSVHVHLVCKAQYSNKILGYLFPTFCVLYSCVMSAVPNLPEGTPGLHSNGVPNSVTNRSPHSHFKLHDTPVENFRPIKVIVIGAGYSGIYCGIRIPEKIKNVELVIYEKNAGVGGTWYENRYLGCACDVPCSSSLRFEFPRF